MSKKMLSFLVILVSILLFTPSNYALNYKWKDIEKWFGSINASATTIKIEFKSSLYNKNKYLADDQFELYENVVYIGIYIVGSTSNISIKKIVIISPSGYERDIYMVKGISMYKGIPLYRPAPYELNSENPLIFNETGIWTIEVQTNSSTYICEYKGDIKDFNGNSEVINYYGNRKGIEVLPPSAIQQLATAIETKNLVKWQKLMVIVTGCMVIITAIAIVSDIIFYKKKEEKLLIAMEEIAKHLMEIERIMEKMGKKGKE